MIVDQITDWDDAYANGIHIPGGLEYPERWLAAAAAFRDSHPPRMLAGSELYMPEGTPKGLVVIVHGGYWMKFGPQWFSHLAGGPLARGWAVLLPAYTLAPAGTLRQMRNEIAGTIAQIAVTIPGPVVITGHSAGAHLAARLVCSNTALPDGIVARIPRALLLSGLFDLRPLQRTSMRETLALDDTTALTESPAFHSPCEAMNLHVWVGEDERPVFVQQSRLLFDAWAGIPRQSTLTIESGRHHMDVVDGLTRPDHPLTEALVGGL